MVVFTSPRTTNHFHFSEYLLYSASRGVGERPVVCQLTCRRAKDREKKKLKPKTGLSTTKIWSQNSKQSSTYDMQKKKHLTKTQRYTNNKRPMNPKLQKGANTNKTRKAGRTHLRCLADDWELQSQRSGGAFLDYRWDLRYNELMDIYIEKWAKGSNYW